MKLFQNMSKVVLFQVVVASLILPLYLGIHFLSTSNCKAHFDLNLPPGSLSGFSLSPPAENFNESKSSKPPTLAGMFVPEELSFTLSSGTNVSYQHTQERMNDIIKCIWQLSPSKPIIYQYSNSLLIIIF